MKIFTKIVLLAVFICTNFMFVQASSYIEIKVPPQVLEPKLLSLENLHKLARSIYAKPINEKILRFSEYFMGKPYNFTIGEKLISWDQDRNQLALINIDTFDCISYVEMVLALAKTSPVPRDIKVFVTMFLNNLTNLMFSQKDTTYYTRNHFIDTEWLKHNSSIIGKNVFSNLDYTRHKTALINKSGLLDTQLHNYAEKYMPKNQHINFFNKYKKSLVEVKPIYSNVNYITFSDFLSCERVLTKKLKGKIYLFVMIMDNPKMLELTNSDHNVGHVGFVFVRNNKLYLRHATSIGNKVVEEQLLSTVAQSKQNSKIFPGFTLFEIKG
ncbi:MAG: N-acetylmuramoyl-L-alanine amidase-like domain-containing protein [Rickettsiales endosymbiont of Dermacentor nuttalli]